MCTFVRRAATDAHGGWASGGTGRVARAGAGRPGGCSAERFVGHLGTGPRVGARRNRRRERIQHAVGVGGRRLLFAPVRRSRRVRGTFPAGGVGGGTRDNPARALLPPEGVGLFRVGEGTRDNPYYEVGTTELWLPAA